MSTSEHTGAAAEPTRVLGLVTDPDMPTQVGTRVSGQLVDWLRRRTGQCWDVQVVSAPLATTESDSEQVLQRVHGYLAHHDWTYAICLTDLPLLLPTSPLLADASIARGVALVSVPALGGLQPVRRMRQVLTQLLDHLLDRGRASDGGPEDHRMSSGLTSLLGPIRRVTAPSEGIDVRYRASRRRGWIRLVSGMVRTNRPERLVWGLSSALVAALAAAGFGLVTSTVWQLGDALRPWRAAATAAFSLALMTVWLIAGHGLWERVGRRAVRDRRLALLYNTSTVTTLGIGVGCLYVVVYVVAAVAAVLLVEDSVLEQAVRHAVDWSTYARLAWMVSAMAIVAGALGSGLESDQAVRQAAYGYREERRRAQQDTAA